MAARQLVEAYPSRRCTLPFARTARKQETITQSAVSLGPKHLMFQWSFPSPDVLPGAVVKRTVVQQVLTSQEAGVARTPVQRLAVVGCGEEDSGAVGVDKSGGWCCTDTSPAPGCSQSLAVLSAWLFSAPGCSKRLAVVGCGEEESCAAGVDKSGGWCCTDTSPAPGCSQSLAVLRAWLFSEPGCSQSLAVLSAWLFSEPGCCGLW